MKKHSQIKHPVIRLRLLQATYGFVTHLGVACIRRSRNTGSPIPYLIKSQKKTDAPDESPRQPPAMKKHSQIKHPVIRLRLLQATSTDL
ncbi:hypothetical protein [Legionella worsleiensis]|uniref:hypothetical protein n=1 Tax=Legionella worsleiensis TaxID=45076 RepID=UPI000DF8B624|nr:hypothetical protein [Legionella worsleiensis]STY33101.1 Uncharacterised protein [Legionella worsleiensis]